MSVSWYTMLMQRQGLAGNFQFCVSTCRNLWFRSRENFQLITVSPPSTSTLRGFLVGGESWCLVLICRETFRPHIPFIWTDEGLVWLGGRCHVILVEGCAWWKHRIQNTKPKSGAEINQHNYNLVVVDDIEKRHPLSLNLHFSPILVFQSFVDITENIKSEKIHIWATFKLRCFVL